MTRLLHTGDTHIGYQQYHSPERRADFLLAFEQVVDDAVEMDVDAVVHAGDLFHDRRPDLPELLGTLSALRQLAAADIPFLAVVGNHESTRGGQWLDLFERLELATRLGSEPVEVGTVALYGLDHVPESRRSDLAYEFTPVDDSTVDDSAANAATAGDSTAEAATADTTRSDAAPTHTALVGHGLFTPFAHANWETETVLAESTVEFDAVLLGDNHTPGVERVEGAWVTYCGSTERASANEADARGYNVVGFDAETPGPDGVDIRRRSLSTRPFVFASVDLESGEGVDRVREQVRQHDLEDAVVIVEITGDGEPVAPADIESVALDDGALVARVTDRREIETDTDLSVSFADPDAAVDARVDELGLSAAALDIDEAVRSPDIADSTLRETLKGRLAETLTDDPAAFTPADRSTADSDAAGDGDNGVDDTGERETADEAAEAASGADGSADGDDRPTETSDDRPTETHGDGADPEEAEASGTAVGEADRGETDRKPASSADDAGATTMEDFL